MRLIDADKLIVYLNDYALTEAPDERESAGERRISEATYNVIQNCIKAVEEQPTALGLAWIPVAERLPEKDKYVLISFENWVGLDIGRYDENEDGGAFFPGDSEKSYSEYGLFVNAWMELPTPYRGE